MLESGWINDVSRVIDAVGVLIIVVGMIVAICRYVYSVSANSNAYREFRQNIGRGILLGLEFLVAADIVRTVAVEPTLDGVLILGVIVLIRTFLSMALEVELEGRWPWRSDRSPRQ